MSTVQNTLSDPYEQISEQFLQDPYPTYERLRDQAPIYKSPNADRWLISRYQDVSAIVRDLRFSSQRYGGASTGTAMMQDERFANVRKSQSNWMLFKDQPDHTRLRGLVNKAFTPAIVDGLRAHVNQIVDGLLDQMASQGSTDLIADYAFLLPITVIAAMLGVPLADHARFSRWSRALTGASDVQMRPERLSGANDAAAELSDYFGHMVALRRKDPQDDLISALVAAEEQGNKLTTTEVVDNSIMLLFAGHETTVNLIGNGTYALLHNPEQLKKLQDTPDLIKTAVEELLRYDSPVQYTRRVLKEDVEYGGIVMRKSELVITIIGAANRDPAQFDRPDCLDITRADNKHLAFGGGVHYCLGASLSRLEAELAIMKLINRFPDLKLGSEKVMYRDSAGFRGLQNLMLTL
jgi:cytochrome P450